MHMVNFCDGDNDKANEYIASFMDRSLTSRLGIRLLVKHHLALKGQMHDENVCIIPYLLYRLVINSLASRIVKNWNNWYKMETSRRNWRSGKKNSIRKWCYKFAARQIRWTYRSLFPIYTNCYRIHFGRNISKCISVYTCLFII